MPCWCSSRVTHAPRPHACPRCHTLANACRLVIPDSEDEEGGECGDGCLPTATQAAVADVLAGCASTEEQHQQQPAATLALSRSAAWWAEHPALEAPALALLLPRDQWGELGHDWRRHGLAGGRATPAQLLALVHAYYAEPLPPEEVLALLRSAPGGRAAPSLRAAFAGGEPVARGALLGARVALEGLRRATRDPGGCVYEVQLGC